MYGRAVFACFSLLVILSLGVFGCSSGGTVAAGSEGTEPLPTPTSDFSATPTQGEAPLSVSFTNLSSVTAATGAVFFWRFGDGGTSNLENPTHIYAIPGTYTVALSVFTTDGTTDTESKVNLISALNRPVPEFSAIPLSGPVPLMVFFTDESDLGGASGGTYLWEFGDGGTSTVPSPSHEYMDADVYTVTLTLTTLGGTEDITKNDFVEVFPLSPIANFSADPTMGEAPVSVQFTNLSDLNGAPGALYFWEFGDGDTSTEVDPLHEYLTGDLFTVTLTVTTLGGDDMATAQILTAGLPTADFLAAPTLGAIPLDVEFTNLSDLASAETATYSWDFGDVSFSTDEQPMHTYLAPGVYTVKLVVTTVGGEDDEEKIDHVEVLLPPVAEFSANPSAGIFPLEVNFANESDLGGAVSATYFWDFGDTFTSTDEHPVHEYTAPDFYTVSLSVTTVGVTDTLVKEEFIDVLPLTSREFYLMFPESLTPASSELSLYVASRVITSGTVNIPLVHIRGTEDPELFLEFLELFSVDDPGTLVEVQILNDAIIESDGQRDNDRVFFRRGTEVRASAPISVYFANTQAGSSDGYLGLPIEALGFEYYVLSWSGEGGGPDSLASEFGIVGTQSGTLVSITTTANVGFFDGDTRDDFVLTHPRGSTYDVFLGRLDVYQVQTSGVTVADLDFTGTHITSNKPIAVFSGNIAAEVPEEDIGTADHLVEQLPPVSGWGTEYIAVSLANRIGGDSYRIMASENSTTVTIQGEVVPEVIVLNAGQFVSRNLPEINRIEADKPILVAQFANGAEFDDPTGTSRALGDPFMMLLFPPERFLSRYNFTTATIGDPAVNFTQNFINIVALTEDADAEEILLDGVPVVSFEKVTGTDYSAARIEITIPGSHLMSGPNPFGLYIYGWSADNSYGFPGGYAF